MDRLRAEPLRAPEVPEPYGHWPPGDLRALHFEADTDELVVEVGRVPGFRSLAMVIAIVHGSGALTGGFVLVMADGHQAMVGPRSVLGEIPWADETDAGPDPITEAPG